MDEGMTAANERYAASFGLAGLSPVAAQGIVIVTCMDTRIEPLPALGLVPGDAKILRNAGGRVTPDVLRSVALATAFLGVSRVAVMHHTRCALAGRDDAALRAEMREPEASGTAGWTLGGMADPDAALRADVEAVRACPALTPGLPVEGWRYDVDTGRVHVVVDDRG